MSLTRSQERLRERFAKVSNLLYYLLPFLLSFLLSSVKLCHNHITKFWKVMIYTSVYAYKVRFLKLITYMCICIDIRLQQYKENEEGWSALMMIHHALLHECYTVAFAGWQLQSRQEKFLFKTTKEDGKHIISSVSSWNETRIADVFFVVLILKEMKFNSATHLAHYHIAPQTFCSISTSRWATRTKYSLMRHKGDPLTSSV